MDNRQISDREARLLNGEALERRFDGPIPDYVANPKAETAAMVDHHRAMIRFSEGRLRDFAGSLAKLKAGPQGDSTRAWIIRTLAIIADHKADKERHEHALQALLHSLAPPMAAE